MFSLYRIVDLSSQLLANALIATPTAGSFVAYNIIAIIKCLSILPLALTQSRKPALPEQLSYQPFVVFRVSPLVSLGISVTGVSTATFGSDGPLIDSAVSLSISQIALFLVVSIIGCIISKIPSGILADRLPLGVILMTFSIMAKIISLLLTTDLVYLDIAGGIIQVPWGSYCPSCLDSRPFRSIRSVRPMPATLSANLKCWGSEVADLHRCRWGDHLATDFRSIDRKDCHPGDVHLYLDCAFPDDALYDLSKFYWPHPLFTRANAYVPRAWLFIAMIIRGRRGRTRSSDA